MGFWRRRARDGIAASAEACFPVNDLGAPDWRQTAMVERTLAWIDELPPHKGRQLLLLYIVVELLAPILTLRLRRFSKLAVERRERAINRWRYSRVYLLRIIGEALKASLTMMYLSHPDAIAYTSAYKACEYPDDPLPFPFRANVFETAGPS